jgi:hypothetical protein
LTTRVVDHRPPGRKARWPADLELADYLDDVAAELHLIPVSVDET